MKKLIVLFLLLGSTFLLSAFPASAQQPGRVQLTQAAQQAAVAAPGSNDINICPTGGAFGGGKLCSAGLNNGLFGSIINIIFVVAILIALAFLILGGIRYITSQGDKAKVESARNQLIAALIGLIIVFLSFFLLNIVTSLLFGQDAAGLLQKVIGQGIFS